MPLPTPSFFFGHLPEFGNDPLRFLETCAREGGDFVPLRFLHRAVVLVNKPADIEIILATRSKLFRKTIGYRTPFMRRLFGQGLLTSEGALWTQQRRLAQPAFHRERIATYARIISQFTEEMLGAWQAGEKRDLHEEVLKLTTRVVVKTLFNAEVPASISQLGDASAVVLKRFTLQWSAWRMFKAILPSPSTRRFRKVMQDLDTFIYELIEERRKSGKDVGDLLSMLLLARDEEGRGMDDRQLRDELVTLMVAGLDTTALAVSWALYLLAKSPGQQELLMTELARVVGGRPLAFADLPQLKFAEAVLKESMRLYPPAWVLGREAIQDCELTNQKITRGTSILMSQWLKHRDPRYFAEAEMFRPDRWFEDGEKKLPKFAYFPFGGGPRICIGNNFAMMEGTLVLAAMVQKFRLTCDPDYKVEPWPTITLQPKDGIWLRLEKRN